MLDGLVVRVVCPNWIDRIYNPISFQGGGYVL